MIHVFSSASMRVGKEKGTFLEKNGYSVVMDGRIGRLFRGDLYLLLALLDFFVVRDERANFPTHPKAVHCVTWRSES